MIAVMDGVEMIDRMALELVTMVMVAILVILGIIMMTVTCGHQDWYIRCYVLVLLCIPVTVATTKRRQ